MRVWNEFVEVIIIPLRVIFVGFTIYLIYSIIKNLIKLKHEKTKKNKLKLTTFSVILCVCILLGYSEPSERIRVKMDTVPAVFTYLEENKSCDFDTGKMHGFICYENDDETEKLLKQINMTDEEKEASGLSYPKYSLYGEIDGVKIYFEQWKYTRWESRFSEVDLLGLPDNSAGIIDLYLFSGTECVYVYIVDYGNNPLKILWFLNHPDFFYPPVIDFNEILSSVK